MFIYMVMMVVFVGVVSYCMVSCSVVVVVNGYRVVLVVKNVVSIVR